jgi:hypothetical protein
VHLAVAKTVSVLAMTTLELFLIGIPACMLLFAMLSVALGPVSRADLRLMATLLRRGKPAPS